MYGILNINKAAGWTSRDAVNRVQRLVRPAKAGHAGTLDPLATGVLVVCVGPATRLISHVQRQAKTYEATFLLGQSSPSDDIETELTPVAAAPRPSLADIESCLPSFLGRIQQLPPKFSAVKIDGQRAYKLARKGAAVEMKPRTVEIYALEVVAYTYPELRILMQCGSGTYVRSVGRDLARSLGTEAVMSQLQRTAIGEFTVRSAIDVDSLSPEIIQQNLISAAAAVPDLRKLHLSEVQQTEIQHGRLIATTGLDMGLAEDGKEYAALDANSQLVAILREKRPGLLGASCNFSQPS